MNSYILEGVDVQVLEVLSSAGIDYYNWGEDSVIVTAEPDELAKALHLQSVTPEATEWQGVFRIAEIRVGEKTTVPPVRIPEPTKGPFTNSRMDASRENYIKLARKRMEALVQQTIKSFEQTFKQFLSAQKACLVDIQSAQAARYKEGASFEMFKEQYKALAATPQVEAVRFTHGRILVFTANLTATVPGTNDMRELGKFLITIFIGSDAGAQSISCENLTRRVKGARSGMHAPYVYRDGELCPAEILESIYQLISEGELSTAIELLLQHLQTCEDDYLGRHIQAWPRASNP